MGPLPNPSFGGSFKSAHESVVRQLTIGSSRSADRATWTAGPTGGGGVVAYKVDSWGKVALRHKVCQTYFATQSVPYQNCNLAYFVAQRSMHTWHETCIQREQYFATQSMPKYMACVMHTQSTLWRKVRVHTKAMPLRWHGACLIRVRVRCRQVGRRPVV